MRKRFAFRPVRVLTLCVFLMNTGASSLSAQTPPSAMSETQWISQRIFENECSGKPECLIAWNQGEDFVSLGIGHFIAYPRDNRDRFVESFPRLLDFMRSKGVHVPHKVEKVLKSRWLKHEKNFLKGMRKGKFEPLREFLLDTQPLQTEFMVERLRESLPRLLEAVPAADQSVMRRKLAALIKAEEGLYALIDYVNFKGEGLSPEERYQDQGWGLLQVIEMMKRPAPGDDVLTEFSNAAALVLARRVENAPKARNEERWLIGWLNRAASYIPPSQGVQVSRNAELRQHLLVSVLDEVPIHDKLHFENHDDLMPMPVPAA